MGIRSTFWLLEEPTLSLHKADISLQDFCQETAGKGLKDMFQRNPPLHSHLDVSQCYFHILIIPKTDLVESPAVRICGVQVASTEPWAIFLVWSRKSKIYFKLFCHISLFLNSMKILLVCKPFLKQLKQNTEHVDTKITSTLSSFRMNPSPSQT